VIDVLPHGSHLLAVIVSSLLLVATSTALFSNAGVVTVSAVNLPAPVHGRQ